MNGHQVSTTSIDYETDLDTLFDVKFQARLPITEISPRLIHLDLSTFNIAPSILRQLQIFFRHSHPTPHETPQRALLD